MIHWIYRDSLCHGGGRYDPKTGNFTEITVSLTNVTQVNGVQQLVELGLNFDTLRAKILAGLPPEEKEAMVVQSTQTVVERILGTIHREAREMSERLRGAVAEGFKEGKI